MNMYKVYRVNSKLVVLEPSHRLQREDCAYSFQLHSQPYHTGNLKLAKCINHVFIFLYLVMFQSLKKPSWLGRDCLSQGQPIFREGSLSWEQAFDTQTNQSRAHPACLSTAGGNISLL